MLFGFQMASSMIPKYNNKEVSLYLCESSFCRDCHFRGGGALLLGFNTKVKTKRLFRGAIILGGPGGSASFRILW